MTTQTAALDQLRTQALDWLADDPDPIDQQELRAVLDALPGSAAELADRFAGPLTFGTAGLRGPLRAGPNGMNRAVVRRAAAGLANWLDQHDATGPVIIGYDARHRSQEFAEETARVVTGTGRAALLLPRPLPTPVLAYAVRALAGVAGVMVTASHNPPQDNGYKVYLGAALGGPAGDGAQIVPPVDAQIEAAIQAVHRLSTVPLGTPGTVLDDEIVRSYLTSVAGIVDPHRPKDLTVAYTPLHGVGGQLVLAALPAAGFAAPAIEASQAEPDPDFPTVAFPNPEEPGAMSRVIALAVDINADLAIANDPDADRCAVAVPTARGWRVLRGDEVGILLADHLIRRGTAGRYVTTIVSSSLLGALCTARGLPYSETLTGFKWIMRAAPPAADPTSPDLTASDLTASGLTTSDLTTSDLTASDLVYGYEEALGYCVAPDLVRDKDGISAAILICELAASLKADLRTLTDRLDDLAAEFGVYATDQLSIRFDDLTEITDTMSLIRRRPPTTLLDDPVTSTEDLLPDSDVLILRTSTARVVVRPSGTEPKLKAYLETIEPVPDSDVPAARERAAASLAALRTEIEHALGL